MWLYRGGVNHKRGLRVRGPMWRLTCNLSQTQGTTGLIGRLLIGMLLRSGRLLIGMLLRSHVAEAVPVPVDVRVVPAPIIQDFCIIPRNQSLQEDGVVILESIGIDDRNGLGLLGSTLWPELLDLTLAAGGSSQAPKFALQSCSTVSSFDFSREARGFGATLQALAFLLGIASSGSTSVGGGFAVFLALLGCFKAS